MTYQKRDYKKNSGRGGSSYGHSSYGKPAWNNGSSDEKIRFQTVCAECGKDCTVPFKPNGRKPVLCRECFRGAEDTTPRNHSTGPLSFGDNSARKPSIKREPVQREKIGPSLKEEISSINRKIGRILDLLEKN